MKNRLFITVAALIISTFAVYAQDVEEESVTFFQLKTRQDAALKRVVWGIKGNIGAELPYAKWEHDGDRIRMFNSGFGASLGGVANIYIGKWFYFEPEISLFYEGYSYNNMTAVTPNSPYVNAGPSIHKLGLRLPLVFGYFINISDTWGLDVFTGPEISYAFYGNARSDNEDVKGNENLMNVYKGIYAQQRWDIDWKIGVGFPVGNFLISLEGDLGINDMLKKGTMRENRVGLGITYYFVDP